MTNSALQMVGRVVKKARIDKGMKQSLVCEAIGVSQWYLSQIECGHVDPRFEVIVRLADTLGISVECLADARRKDTHA